MKHFHPLLRISLASAITASAHAAVVQNVDKTFSTTTPPITDDVYFYNNPAGNTWTVNGAITMGNGTTADSRLFVGLNSSGANNGLLTMTSTVGGSTLLLNGYHSADAVLGRLGHVNGGNWTGTININGGLAVTMGGRDMRYDGNGTNNINILDGSLNYTNSAFGWQEANTSFVKHTIGANGALNVLGSFTDAAGFSAWAVTNGTGVELNDVTVEAASGLTLNFATNAGVTTITAVPEPSAALLGGLGFLALLRRRRN